MPTDAVSTPITASVIQIRYEELEQLGSGGMGTVYRVFDRLNNQYVALKRVSAAPELLWFNSVSESSHTDLRVALAHEFQTLASLRHPNIISVLDYGFDANQGSYFTMELLENTKTILEASKDQPLNGQIALLTQVLQALAYLHRRGILHRDLKPANVLVTGDHVKVLDFGLSVTGEKATGTSGTVAYMAPETLQGEVSSIAADLYSVGVIAYEMLVGHHPFDTNNLSTLIEQILTDAPDFSSITLDDRLKNILKKLLQKSPDLRYANADEVVKAFNEVVLQQPALETASIRESYLQAARLVGRERELNQFSDIVKQTIGGKGSAWLIGGESGVGKSRLIDEIRIEALVRGALVLRGQAVSDGSEAYQIWRDSLRWLALMTDPATLEASILKPLVPNIGVLLRRDVPDAPYLDPVAAKTRLTTTLLNILQRQMYPVVIILEDLQWAGTESLDLLKAMIQLSKTMRLLIIGNYRDDEAPTLPALLGSVQVLKLGRLQPESIAELSVSILGEGGKQPHIINLLQRETEGNVFFLVEVVRALAEEAGQLDKIIDMTLPATIVAGGVQKLVQRRLQRVAAEHQLLLQIAAVAGRELDLILLKAMNKVASIDTWLTNCADAAVLEFYEGHWRFAHDKLREGLLADLSPEKRRELHQQLAATMETAYAGLRGKAAALTYHWGMAQNAAKEGYYAGIAGEEALQSGATQEAVNFLKKALALDVTLKDSAADHKQWKLRRATRERQLGQAYYGLGKLVESRPHLQAALDLLGRKLPGKWLPVDLIRQLGRQLLHRAGLIHHSTDPVLLEAARVYGLLGEITYFTMETVLGLDCTLNMLNLAEKAPASPELARAYVNMCIATSLIPLHKSAEAYSIRARQAAAKLEHESVLIQVLTYSAVFYVGMGQWTQADALLDQAHAIAERLGDRREAITTRTTPAVMRHYQGRFAEAIQLNDFSYNAALQIGNVQQQGWGTYSKAENLMRLGRFEEALTSLDMAQKLVAGDIRRASEARIHSARAMIYLRQGRFAEAQQSITEVLELIGKSSPTVYSGLECYSAIGDVYLTLLELGKDTEKRQDFMALAAQGCKILRKYAHLYPVGQARAMLWQGRLDWLHNKPEQAQEAWLQGLAAAEKFQMLYDQGLAHYEIGRHLEPESPARQMHLSRAAEIFKQVNAVYDLERI